ncbi:MAG: hypothetical protein EON60_01185 [Alphaproteobacteria bacterium]|nr:MAG: hypothetical protein EON60_01185 [Alphaproteobacteria bacterium]
MIRPLSLAVTALTAFAIQAHAQIRTESSDTAALPGISWTSDTNTGLYSPAADVIGFSTGGTERVRFNVTGISTTGVVRALQFIGDGSLLTNISASDNLGNHTATTDLTMGTNAITFNTSTGDKIYLGSTKTYGIGMEASTITTWAPSNFRWRLGGTAVTSGSQQMLLNASGLNVSGSLSVNNDDAVTAPGFTWNGDTNTGMYWVGADQIGLTTAGAQRVLVNSTGLTVTGRISTTGIIDAGSYIYGYTGDSATAPGYTWSGDNNTGIYNYAADQLGITTGGAVRGVFSSTGLNMMSHKITGILSPTANTEAANKQYVDTVAANAADDLGNHTATQAILGTTGTAALPGYTFNGDTNTGMYWVGSDQVGVTVGGVQQLLVRNTGLIVSGSVLANNVGDIATAPSYSWSGDTNTGLYWVGADQVGVTVGGVQQLLIRSTGLTVSGSVLANNVGDVATAPSYSWSGDTNTGIYWPASDQIGITTGGTQRAVFSGTGLRVIGTITTTGIIDAGSYIYGYTGDSAAAPGYTWSGDNNTGMFNASGDVIGFSTTGTERVRFNSAGISTTGSIFLNSGGNIVADSFDTNYTSSLGLYGGSSSPNTGAAIALYGVDHTTAGGRMLLYATSDTTGALLYRFYSRTTGGTNGTILSLYQGGDAVLTGEMTASKFNGDGSGLTNVPNGTITLTGNVTGSGTGSIATSIAANAVTTARIADNAVTTAKINTSAVTAAELASNAVTTVKIADNAVTAAKIATNSITGAELASNAVSSTHIIDGSIAAADLASNAVSTVKIADNAVTTAKINTGAVTANELASNAVTSVKIADSAVSLAKIQNISTNRLLGRATTGTGDVEQITVGSGLQFTGTTLSVSTGTNECTTNITSVTSDCGESPGACPSNYTSILTVRSTSACALGGDNGNNQYTTIRHCIRVRC